MKAPNLAARARRKWAMTILAPVALLLCACTGQTSGTNPPPAPVAVAVAPKTASVQTGQTQQFSANVTGTTNTTVTWSLSSTSASAPSLGTISATGMYTAPATVPTGGTVTVTATSQADTSKVDSATVTITAPAITVALSPKTPSVQVGLTQQFTAVVANDSQNKGVTWSLTGTSCSGSACGTLSTGASASGQAIVYTAPATVPSGTVTVKATSVADSTKSDSTNITVSAAPVISITLSPTVANVQAGIGSQNFTAALTNDTGNKGVTWALSGTGCSGATCGTLTNVTTTSVTYNAPASVPTPATVTLKATSIADTTKSSTAGITVTAAVSVSIAPLTASVQTGKTQQFTATVTNTSNTAVTWQVNGTAGGNATVGTVNASGLYTAPATVPTGGTVTVTAISQADGSKSASATVTVTAPPPIVVTVAPTTASVQVGLTQQFTATVTNTSNTAVTWQVNGTTGGNATTGTITTGGLFTAPAAVPTGGTVTVTAVSQADNTKSASATVTITTAPVIVITLAPTSASVQAGIGTQNFTATLTNDTGSKGVTWSLSGTGCSGATCGTLTNVTTTSVTYNAPTTAPSPATVTLKATSVADTTKSTTVPITVTAAVGVTVAPTSATINVTKTQNFTATVTNDALSKGVTWTLSGTGCGGTACGTLSASSSASGAAITYTAPASVPSPATVTLKATSVADSTKSASATITIAPAIAVSVAPTSANVTVSLTQSFTATVTNDAQNKGVSWALSGTGCSGTTCGTLTSVTTTAATYNAPATVPSPATVTLTATSVADNTKSSAATITVMLPISTVVAIVPKRGALTPGQTLAFSATVNGSASTAVTWEVDTLPGGSATVGTIDGSGVYTAPNSGGVHNIVARSTADTTATSPASPIGVTNLAGVYTYHNDNSRTGANTQEFALTKANVNTTTFGKMFSCGVDAAIYAQPLWAANVSISGVNHNVVYVATEHDTLYAFDADSNGSPCVPLWTASLLDATHGGATGETWVTSTDASCDDLVPDIGIVGTPVIDATTNTLYVVSKTKNTAVKPFHQRIHAIDMTTGAEKFSGPVEISASVSGTGAGSSGGKVTFDALLNNERPALLLTGSGATSHVIISWASHCDVGPYHGWVMSYSGGTLAQEAVLNVSPNGIDTGIWMSGGGPAADAAGNIYLATGNGTFDANSGTAPNNDYGDTVMKLGPPSGGTFAVLSYFRPFTITSPDVPDTDQGSGGVLLLPPLSGNNHMLQAGKDGNIYVLDQTALGGFNTSSNAVVQELAGGLSQGMWASPTYWNGFANFGAAFGAAFTQYSVDSTGLLISPSQSRATGFNFPGPTASVSAQGTTSGTGIVWALDNQAYCTASSSSCGSTILHAYDATNLGTEIWNSTKVAADKAGNAVKFAVPTVANGKVYVGTRGNNTGGAASSTAVPGEIDVYGLKPN